MSNGKESRSQTRGVSFVQRAEANDSHQPQETNDEEVHVSDCSDDGQDGQDGQDDEELGDFGVSIQSSPPEASFHPQRDDAHTSSAWPRHQSAASSWPQTNPRSLNQSRYGSKYMGQSYMGTSVYDYKSPYLANQDEDLLSRTVSDCGLHAFGCIFIEAWVLSTDKRHMTRPPGGHWMDPTFIHSLDSPEKAIEINEEAPDCVPGESMAGTLFREASRWRNPNRSGKKVHWRQIKSLVDDPFIQSGSDKRMKRIHDLGIGIAATVPFCFQGRTGIVVFMSRSTADLKKLRSEANERYLIGAADLIGAAFAIRIPRMECSNIRRDLFQSAVKKVMMQIKHKGDDFASLVEQVMHMKQSGKSTTDAQLSTINGDQFQAENHPSILPDFKSEHAPWEMHDSLINPAHILKHWFGVIFHHVEHSFYKWGGAGVHGPPRQSTAECVAIFVGSFCVIMALLRLAEFLSDNTTDWTYDGNWYSSSLCIIFALTPAPVGQPRQIILAHLWCGLVGYTFQQIPSTTTIENLSDLKAVAPELRAGVIPLQWKQSFSVALAISGQAFFGILHPPSTGLAFTFATLSTWDLRNLLCVLVGDTVMIIMSMIILNLQPRKQYPMFWFGHNWKSPEGIKRRPRFFRKSKREKSCKEPSQLNGNDSTFEQNLPQDKAIPREANV